MKNTYPLSPIKKVGDLFFISGQIGVKNGELVSGGIREQTAQAIRNIQDLLGQSNLKLSDVVDVIVFLTEQKDYEDFNQEYINFFNEPFPTRTTVTVKSLPTGAKIEIKAIAKV